MRKKILALPAPRGFFPYAYSEEIRERGRRLVAFLDFINDDDNRPDRYWALFAPFLFDEEASNIEEEFYEAYRLVMGQLDEKQRQTLRKELREDFERLRSNPVRTITVMKREGELTLGRVPLAGAGEIYYSLPTFVLFFLKKDVRKMMRRPIPRGAVRFSPKTARNVFENLQTMCNLLLWWCLSWLRSQAIQRCENCQKYVLRVTAHDVKFCSDACRWQAFASKRNPMGKDRGAVPPRTSSKHQPR